MSEFEWRVIEPLLPNKARCVARVDVRRVLNGYSRYGVRVRRGGTFPVAMALIQRVIIAFAAGRLRACGIA